MTAELERSAGRAQGRGGLRAACQLLEAIGMEGFAERARRELRAAGVPPASVP